MASAAAITLAVPWTLVFHASAGNRSRTGRCLSAAAWKTTCGRCTSKIASSAARSRMSPSTNSSESSRALPCIDIDRACSADSSRSSITRDAGESPLIWRESSEPMDPPAPVTRMRRPATSERTAAGSGRETARPMRSATSISRMEERGTSSPMSSEIDGTVRSQAPCAAAWSDRRANSAGDALAIATTAPSAPVRSRTAPRSSVVPWTPTPWTRKPRLLRSSSSSAIGRYGLAGSRSICSTREGPTSPAPTITTGAARCGRFSRATSIRTACLSATISTSARSQARTGSSSRALPPVATEATTSAMSTAAALVPIGGSSPLDPIGWRWLYIPVEMPATSWTMIAVPTRRGPPAVEGSSAIPAARSQAVTHARASARPSTAKDTSGELRRSPRRVRAEGQCGSGAVAGRDCGAGTGPPGGASGKRGTGAVGSQARSGVRRGARRGRRWHRGSGESPALGARSRRRRSDGRRARGPRAGRRAPRAAARWRS